MKIALLSILLLSSFSLQTFLRQLGSSAMTLLPLPAQYWGLSIDPKIVRRLLGIRLTVADLIWVDTLLKADIEREKDPFSTFYRAIKTISILDPDNLNAYYVGGLYLSVIKDDRQAATALLRDGARYMEESGLEKKPEAWRVYFVLGYHLLLEEQDFEEAPQWIIKAAAYEGAPSHIKSLAQRVSTERGRLEVGQRVLIDFRSRLKSENEIKRVEEKIVSLTCKQELFEMNEKFEIFLSNTGAYALPRKRAFELFLRSTGMSRKDMLGRPLKLNDLGKIAVEF